MSGRVIVYGGSGQLGRALVRHFRDKKWQTISVDGGENADATYNVVVDLEKEWKGQAEMVEKGISLSLSGEKADSILCVAGGWAGGGVDADFAELTASAELMWKQSVWSSVIAAKVARDHLKEGGLLQLTGAIGALSGSPGMLGYGMAKAAVHQLVRGLAVEGSGLPEGANAVAILPGTLDTAMNRKFMPQADFSGWTPLPYVADLLYGWSVNPGSRPESGSLVKLVTENSESRTEIAEHAL